MVNLLKPGTYFIDQYNLNPIFLINNKSSSFESDNCFVRSWEEALELNGKPKVEDINFNYIACIISGVYRSNVSPYIKITRLPRASKVIIFEDGSYKCQLINQFDYKSKPLVRKDFNYKLRSIFFDDINSLIKNSDNLIGAEFSGGLDSTLIVGALLKLADNKDKKRIHTFSYKFKNELDAIKICRDFYEIPNTNAHLFELSKSKKTILEILGFLPQVPYAISQCEVFTNKNCNLILSGFGGDQCLTNNGNNIPTDLINQKRFKELLEWSGSRIKFLKILLKRYAYLLFPVLFSSKLKIKPTKFLDRRILCSNLTENIKPSVNALLNDFYACEIDVFMGTKESILKRITSDNLALRVEQETLISKYFGIRKYFPLLNKKIIKLILEQDVLTFSKSSTKKRNLVVEVFNDVLPPHLISHPTKDYFASTEVVHNSYQAQKDFIEKFLESKNSFHSFLYEIWNFNSLKKQINAIYSRNKKNNSNLTKVCEAVRIINRLNNWFLFLDDK